MVVRRDPPLCPRIRRFDRRIPGIAEARPRSPARSRRPHGRLSPMKPGTTRLGAADAAPGTPWQRPCVARALRENVAAGPGRRRAGGRPHPQRRHRPRPQTIPTDHGRRRSTSRPGNPGEAGRGSAVGDDHPVPDRALPGRALPRRTMPAHHTGPRRHSPAASPIASRPTKKDSPVGRSPTGLIKSAMTYFPAVQYHRRQELNF